MRRACRELGFGARLAWIGGGDARWRAALTAVGVALGVALLLAAASVPSMVHSHDARVASMQVEVNSDAAGPRTRLLQLFSDTVLRGTAISGMDLQRVGPNPPLPPGVSRIPVPGQMIVSPALRDLLRSPAGAELARRLHARVVGTIADSGLAGSSDLRFYRGAPDLRARGAISVLRFGGPRNNDFHGPLGTMLVILMAVALLLPIGVFVATASRFGSDQRNVRLSAMRLIGADRAATARIAAGESLFGALIGVILGCLLFLVVRVAMGHVDIAGVSVFTSDVRPAAWLAVLIVLVVPAASVMVTLMAMRRVAIEPLSVSRHGGEPSRRLLWRVVTPLFGFALLLPLISSNERLQTTGGQIEASAGVVFVLIGVCALLPWVVDAVARHADGGPVPWLLAVRRLRADHGTSGRVVSAIGLAVAGAIALQTVFNAADARVSRHTSVNPAGNSVQVFGMLPGGADPAGQVVRQLRATPGVRSAIAVVDVDPDASDPVTVAPCSVLTEVLGKRPCGSDSSFIINGYSKVHPGQILRVNGRRIRVPGSARRVSVPSLPGQVEFTYISDGVVLLAPGAAHELGIVGGRVDASVQLDPNVRDAGDRVRDEVARIDPIASVTTIASSPVNHTLEQLQTVLFAGAAAVLIVIGCSLLVTVAEQLRERRRVLAVLAAFGTRRSTLAWSVVLQNTLPVAFGLVIAVGLGIALGDVLMHIVGLQADFRWGAIALLAAAGAGVVAAVTALTLPMLWRQMRPDALRTE